MSLYHVFRNKLELSAFEFFTELALQPCTERVQRPLTPKRPTTLPQSSSRTRTNRIPIRRWRCSNTAPNGLAGGRRHQSERNASQELWRLREDISESILSTNPTRTTSRFSRVPALLAEIDELLGGNTRISRCCGMATSATAICTSTSSNRWDLDSATFVQKCGAVSEHLFAVLQRHGGSISAEHGVGLTKSRTCATPVMKPKLATCEPSSRFSIRTAS